MSQSPAPDPQTVRVVRGNPSPEQVAALVVALTALSGADDGSPSGARRRSLWTERSRFPRPRPAVGHGGWRASALPR